MNKITNKKVVIIVMESSSKGLDFFILKQLQFQLLTGCFYFLLLIAKEYLYVSKLLVCNAHYSNFAFLRQTRLNTFDMSLGILCAITMSHIH